MLRTIDVDTISMSTFKIPTVKMWTKLSKLSNSSDPSWELYQPKVVWWKPTYVHKLGIKWSNLDGKKKGPVLPDRLIGAVNILMSKAWNRHFYGRWLACRQNLRKLFVNSWTIYHYSSTIKL
jgi:hypothetical protein